MKPTALAFVQEIDQRIEQLKDLRTRVVEFYGSTAGALVQTFEPPPSNSESQPQNSETRRPMKKLRKQRRKTQKHNGGGRRVETELREEQPEPGPADPALTLDAFKPATLSASMKVEIVQVKEFTLEELQNRVAEKYREEEFYKNAAANSFYGNLSYWAKTGRLEKTGDGATARFKILDKEFFKAAGAQS